MSIEKINGKTYDVWSSWKNYPKDYCCPICHREKRHIIRLNKSGHIMMHINRDGICEDCTNFLVKIKEYRDFAIENNNEKTLSRMIVINNQPHEVSYD